MPKNHAKAIKGMSIACIAVAGIVILVCLAGLAMIALFGPILEEAIMDSYVYNYGYGYGYDYDSIFGAYGISTALEPMHGHHAYYPSDFPNAYDELGEFQVMMTMFNVLLVLGLIAEGIVLAAAIIVLKNHNKPEKFGMVFVWSIVGAVIGFFASGIVQGVLFIIIAVFVNSDKKLYQAGMYFVPVPGMPGAVSSYPSQQPVPPMAPGAPVAPVAQVPAQPVQGVQAAPVAQSAQPMQAAPALEVSVQPAEQSTAQVTTAEIFQPAGGTSIGVGETQPPAPTGAEGVGADAVTIGETAVVAENAIVEEGSNAAVSVQPEALDISSQPASVIVDEGAVIKLDVNGELPSEK